MAKESLARQPCPAAPLRTMLALLAILLGGAMHARAEETAETLAGRAALLAPHFTLIRPEGAGPFPAVIMLHGCGGRRAFLDDYAAAAREAGAASVIVDSYAPRGISRPAAIATVCTGLRLRGAERAGDLFAAMAWIRAQAWADPKRLIAAGWSHGGWTLLDALALKPEEMAEATGLAGLPAEPLAGLAGAFIVYPYVGFPSLAGKRPWRGDVDALAIVAGLDFIVGPRGPRRALERQRELGARIELHRFAGATHAFEEDSALDPRVRYSPEYAARARGLLRTLIARLRESSIRLRSE